MDPARQLVVERNLAAAAFGHLTADAFMTLPFEALGPTKALLKRFFSVEPWTDADADALADAVGPGEGWWLRPLDPDVNLEYGWRDDRFAILLSTTTETAAAEPVDPLAASFDGPVVPEATPNARTIRFRTGPIHGGPSLWFESAASAREDWRAARLFDEFPEVANLLIGPDFVAVSIHRPDEWERLLAPVLAAVASVFEGSVVGDETLPSRGPTAAASARPGRAASGRATRLAQAWADLGPLRTDDARDLAILLAAAEGDDPFRRQVAANLMRETTDTIAADYWTRLVGDPSRAVRRATVDAIVDAGREALRPLLERALSDADAWVRWKALRGLVELGPEPSGDAIAALSDDPDFRVRLEVAAALKHGGGAADIPG